ncbi:hypothetical protein MBLNU230_g6063t1 [Neophaeotheca triangularis]
MSEHHRRSSGTARGRPIPPASSPSRNNALGISQTPSRADSIARLASPVAGSPAGRQEAPDQRDATPSGRQSPLPGFSGAGSLPGPGTSSLSQALRDSQHSPARSYGQPGPDSASLSKVDSPTKRVPRGIQSPFTPGSQNNQLGRSPRQGGEDIEVLRRHLVGPQTGSQPSSYQIPSSMPSERPEVQAQRSEEEEFSSLQLQGGDTTRHIYRYAEAREREQQEAEDVEAGRLRRSRSVILPKHEGEEGSISTIKVPGGLRREHIKRTAASPAPSSINPRKQDYGTTSRAIREQPRHQPQFVANNFIEFLTLYGHFAGETLDEDDEVLGPDEYFSSDNYDESTTQADDERSDDGWGEDSALLTPGKRRRRRKTREAGKGSPMGAAMLLLKSFVGTGVLFLPRAFLNGGMLFSNLVLVFIALLSYYCFILLVSVRLAVPASFGDMGGKVFGAYFKNLINFSLVISQIGFASAYIVFVSENLQAFVLAVSRCRDFIDVTWLILLQMVVFLPISLYRNINNIQKMALAADLFICLGLLYLYYYDIKTIVHQGGIADIQNFNYNDWTLFIGTAIFTFEGVGLVIPIQTGMKDPKKFPTVLAWVMLIISVIFISMGALSYAAYGSHTKTVIISNMPQDNPLVNGVQLIYSLAILLSTPLQIYPAIEITSQQLFSKTGKYNPWIKWQKNIFRFFVVGLVTVIAWAGKNDLDKFVSLVGSFACIPLVYIYPPLMHHRAVATRSWQRWSDLALVVFGFIVMAYTTGLTVRNWVYGNNVKPPGYCDDL